VGLHLERGQLGPAGSKLVGSGGSDAPQQGFSVALSTTAASRWRAAPADINYIGSAWVFTRPIGLGIAPARSCRTIELPHGEGFRELIPTKAGRSRCRRDGSTAVVGAPYDNADCRSVWVYVRTIPRSSHDINGDGKSDIMLASGLDSRLPSASAPSPSNTFAGWLDERQPAVCSRDRRHHPDRLVAGRQHDFNGDGQSDFLVARRKRQSGDLADEWLTISSTASLGNIPTGWTVIGTGDFSGDGYGDICGPTAAGNVAIWFMNGTQLSCRPLSATSPPPGRSSPPATSTATARPIFSGATPAAIPPSGLMKRYAALASASIGQQSR